MCLKSGDLGLNFCRVSQGQAGEEDACCGCQHLHIGTVQHMRGAGVHITKLATTGPGGGACKKSANMHWCMEKSAMHAGIVPLHFTAGSSSLPDTEACACTPKQWFDVHICKLSWFDVHICKLSWCLKAKASLHGCTRTSTHPLSIMQAATETNMHHARAVANNPVISCHPSTLLSTIDRNGAAPFPLSKPCWHSH